MPRIPRKSARLNWISIPAARRLSAIQRRALLIAFGASANVPRRTLSLIMQFSSARASVTVPLKFWASSATVRTVARIQAPGRGSR